MHHFTRDDGLIWDDVNESAFFADSEGSLFFGTSGGLAQYAPHGEEPVRRPLNVVFTSVLIGGKERFGESNASAAHAENSLQVRFSAPTYRRSSAVACRYRLNGLESAFTQTTQREARYGNLPSGAYEIEVACRSPHGPWSAPATYRFSIAAAWWETWWFRLIELLAGGLALYGIILYRTRNLELDRRRLEHAVQARNAELAAAYKELAQKNAELEEASLTDPLTKLHNRRYLDITIHADVAQAIRQHIGLGKVAGNAGPERRRYVANRDIVFYIVDVDHFKDVNDRFGHLAGDTMLIEVARRINSVMRRSDKLVRWGGEEFLVISYPTERTEAQTLASRIMSAFSERPFDLGNSIQLRKTCSIGWAPFPWFVDAPEEINYEKVLWLADRALYAAKSAGRNRAVGLTPLTGAPSIVGDGLLEYQEVHTSGLALSC
jgi:diguanylate cyclase (GGDEF)-like protein